MTSGDYPDETKYKFIARLQNAKANAEDFERSQRALAGLETGDGSNHNHKGRDKGLYAKGLKGGSALSALDLALQDAEYAARYSAFGGLLDRYETAAEKALAKATAALDDLMGRAVRLPDGRAIFRDANGHVWAVDGERLDPDFAAGIIWPDDAPGYADYRRRKQDVDDIRRYQSDVLGAARDRYEDEETPITRKEMDKLEHDISGHSIPLIQRELEQSAPDMFTANTGVAPIDKPTL